MPTKLLRTVKMLALELDAKSHSQGEIAETLAISVDTITRAKRKMKSHGDVKGRKHKRRSKLKMDPRMQDVCFLVFFHC